MDTISPLAQRRAVLRGRDHPGLGVYALAEVGRSLAVGMSAGARAKTSPSFDPNEDVGAAVEGSRAVLLVVADAHFGREASELVVDHVLTAIGDNPPAGDLSDEQLVAVFHGAGVAVERETTRPGCVHPNSRTTLALALVTDDVVQWAAIGDSCVIVATEDGGSRLDTPRNVYLGHRMIATDIAGALTRGTWTSSLDTSVVLATDGLVDGFARRRIDVVAAVAAEARKARAAGELAGAMLAAVLRHEVDDAVTVAASLA